jgi:hypothetical protein
VSSILILSLAKETDTANNKARIKIDTNILVFIFKPPLILSRLSYQMCRQYSIDRYLFLVQTNTILVKAALPDAELMRDISRPSSGGTEY